MNSLKLSSDHTRALAHASIHTQISKQLLKKKKVINKFFLGLISDSGFSNGHVGRYILPGSSGPGNCRSKHSLTRAS